MLSGANHAEAKIVVAVVGVVVVPVSDRTIGSVIVPTAATVYAVRPRRRAERSIFMEFPFEKLY